jgi:hypothetical protein
MPALCSVPEFIDPVFAKTSRKRSVLVIENERFGLVFTKTGSINSGTDFACFEHKTYVFVFLARIHALHAVQGMSHNMITNKTYMRNDKSHVPKAHVACHKQVLRTYA